MKEIITLVSDPGHGWAMVPEARLHQFGIAKDISGFSYLSGGVVALEEDCDLAQYLDQLDKRGISYEFKEVHTDHDAECRSWPSYHYRESL